MSAPSCASEANGSGCASRAHHLQRGEEAPIGGERAGGQAGERTDVSQTNILPVTISRPGHRRVM